MNDTDKIKALGQYPTPFWVAEALVERHFGDLGRSDLVIEPSCGPGAFLSALPEHVQAIGVDVDGAMVDQARGNTGRVIIHGDFRSVPLPASPTAIIGNPPFRLDVIDGFLERAFELLPEGGRVGFILPAYAFQTAGRVAEYADRWSLAQEMIPRNIFPGLSIPLVFARFFKDFRRVLIGFALYGEADDIQRLSAPYREALRAPSVSSWRNVVEIALRELGGKGSLGEIYAKIEGKRPTRTQHWKEKVRQTLRRHADSFEPKGAGHYALAAAA